jgi:fucose 4-O-acetylase-like acetyltransferase
MSTKINEHNRTLDVAKGIAILLVVLGHSFPSNIYNGESMVDIVAATIYNFVYSFHMPVFFCISGYLFFNAWNTHRKGTIKKKALRLLVPYLTFSLIYVPLRIVASGMANSDFDGGYWRILIGISPNGGGMVPIYIVYFLFYYFLFSKTKECENSAYICICNFNNISTWLTTV